MPVKISIEPEVAARIDGPVRVGLNRGADIGIDVQRPGDVVVGINKRPPIQIELAARRTLDGNIMIMDHQSIDIVIMPSKNKFLAFPKDIIHEDVYGAQDRLGKFLTRKGIIDPNTIRSGNVYGSMEYNLLESKIPGIDNVQACMYSLYRYLEQEKPYYDMSGQYAADREDHLLDPSDEFSTDLGDVPHADNKGSVDTRVRPFGYQYNYSIIREEKDEQ